MCHMNIRSAVKNLDSFVDYWSKWSFSEKRYNCVPRQYFKNKSSWVGIWYLFESLELISIIPIYINEEIEF